MTLTFKLRCWLWQRLAGSSQGAPEKSLQQRAAAANRCCWGCLGRRASLVLTVVLFPSFCGSRRPGDTDFNFCVSTGSDRQWVLLVCAAQHQGCAGLVHQTPLAKHGARVDGVCLNNWSFEGWDNRTTKNCCTVCVHWSSKGSEICLRWCIALPEEIGIYLFIFIQRTSFKSCKQSFSKGKWELVA